MPQFKPTPFGDYVLQDRIGAGGMAEIFLATARGIEGFEKRLVIKRILPTLSDDEQFVRMFIEEAKLCVALRHPNIVQVYDLGAIDQQYYIAMEYVDGRDLLKTLAACGKKRVGFPTDIALYIVMEVLKGLDYAHDLKRPDGSPLGIIHRDVSPSNLLLSYEGDVKIGDFGIAKASTREKTATGILKGKFGYMAPEQVLGSAIDHRADVFAIGIVLYELLTGHRLFAGRNDLAVLERVRDAVVDPPPRHYRADLDDELEHLVLKALGRRADDRFQTAGELHDALHDYVFRSRATVGPAQLGRFMQSLFLHEPDEVARRERVNLPPVVPLSVNPTSPPELPTGLDEDFDDKTPLLDLTDDEASSALSEVVYISEEYQWDKPPASDREHTRGQRGQRSPDVDPGFDCVSTVQTDLPEADASAEVQLIASGPATGELRGAVDALREAAKQDQPTDWDLSETHEPSPKKSISRSDSAPTQLDGDDATTGRNKAVSRADSAPTNVDNEAEVDPSLIVERTPSVADPTDPSEIEATVRFDSAQYPALKDPTETASGGYWMPSISDGIDDAYDSQLDEVSQFGTIRVEAPDLSSPAPDVMDSDVADAPRAEGTQISAAPSQMEEVDDEDALEEAHADDVLQMVTAETSLDEEEEEEDAGRTELFEPSESALLSDIRARQGSRVRRVRVSSSARAASGGGSSVPRRRSSPRRRIVTRAPLSVVSRKESSQDDLQTEDPAETTRKSDPAELIARAHAPELKDETGEGPMVPFGRGHEEPTENGEEVDADPTIPEPVVRRESSGITAALNEAALADAEIQEIRAASVVGSNVLEVGNHHDEDDSEELDELTDGFGEDLRSAILKRQARRRLVTRSVVLYGDGSGPKDVTQSGAERQPGDFAEASESSVAGIYDAGQLSDEGASELFGVLSVLDEAPPDFSADDELSVETHPRMYADFGDSMSRVETYDPQDDSVASEEDEYSNTAYGSLAPDETAEAEPDSFAAPSFGSDDQSAITSDSHAGRAFAPPREVSSSGIMLDMDSLLSERAVSDPHGHGYDVPEDETQEGGEPLVRDRSFSPQSTSEERPAHHRSPPVPGDDAGPESGLVSSRFELPSSMELPELNAAPDPEPVRPVTWNRPAGIEPTQSQLDDELLAPKRRNNADVLRAVVERQRVAREKNLNPKKHRASAAAVASPLQPIAARPTPGPTPGAAAPSMIPPVVVTRRRDTNYRVWTIMYLVVGLAVVLAVAAAVSSFQGRQEPAQDLPPATLQTSKTPKAPAQEVLPPKKEVPAKTAPVRSPEPVEEKKVVEKRPPPVQVVEDIEEPPPPKKARRKPRRKTRRRAATPPRKKRASSAASSGMGKIQLSCGKALDIRISTVGRFENKKRFSKKLKAGFYRISLFDPGTQRMRAQLDINLQAGDPVTIPCP